MSIKQILKIPTRYKITRFEETPKDIRDLH